MMKYCDCLQLAHSYIGSEQTQHLFVQKFPHILMSEPSTDAELALDDQDKYYPFSGTSAKSMIFLI